MNKPASKEPSMDEILSSIRQIIADDDAAATPRRPAPAPAPVAAMPRPGLAAAPVPTPPPARPPEPEHEAELEPEPDPEPLALTPEHMLKQEESIDIESGKPGGLLSFGDILDEEQLSSPAPASADPPPLVDPEDVTFDIDEPDEPAPAAAFAPRPAPAPARPAPRAAPSSARAAPMPDPSLSSDMAEQLLEPATNSAVKHAFARLNGVSAVGNGVTLDALVREMLRPMLKDWLDENLPSLVERMVEKEISRISRGGE